MRLSLETQAISPAFATTIPVEPRTNYVVSAWFRSSHLQPTIPPAVRETYHPHSPLVVEAASDGLGGAPLAAAHGYTDSAGWNRQFVGFRTGPNAHRVVIRGLIRNGSGTAWFDDLFVGRLFGTSPLALEGTLSRSRRMIRERGTVPPVPVSLDATYQADGDHVRVDGAVHTSGRRDVAVQVTYTLPVDASGWRWGDDARRSRRIQRGTYSSLSNTSLQKTSVYPFGAVFDDRSMLAIGVPLSRPRMFRVEYVVGRGLTITFDLGLSGAEAAGPRADFSFVVYTADPSWGFRSATRAYYDLFPQSFVHRTDPTCEGSWFVAPPLRSIGKLYRDFGVGLNMVALGKASSQSYTSWGAPYLKWDDDRGIYTSAYGHHWAFYQPIGTAKTPNPTYDRATLGLKNLATRTAGGADHIRLRNEARAALFSSARDFNGHLYYERYGKYLAYYENLDREASTYDWTAAVRQYQIQDVLQTARKAGGRLDGLHLDSTSGMRRWGAADDYDRNHWAAATLPLTFSYDSGLVTERGIFPMYSHITDVAGFVHRRRMILSANFNADLRRTAGFVGADRIDYFGIEQGLEARKLGGTPDEFAMWKRTLAYHRPISTLDARIGVRSLPLSKLETELQRNLFYGIFAGAWNPKAEAEARGTEARWASEPIAHLWSKYTPAFKKLAGMGWEPVTNARSSSRRVWVERFGGGGDRPVAFTVRNETGAARPYRLTIDVGALVRTLPSKASAVEFVTNRRVAVSLERGSRQAVLADVIPPHATKVLVVNLTS